jgi:hypothetical protein
VSDVLVEGFIQSGLMEKPGDPGMRGCNRYGRLPVSTNNKLKYPEPFPVRLVRWEPGRTIDPAELAAMVGIEDLYGQAQRRGMGSVAGVMDPDLAAGHPLIESLRQAELLKGDGGNRRGWWEITCPWVDLHTGEKDDGTAVIVKQDGSWGFNCFHSHDHGAGDLYEHLTGLGFDPG